MYGFYLYSIWKMAILNQIHYFINIQQVLELKGSFKREKSLFSEEQVDRIKRDSMMAVMEVVYSAGNEISFFMLHLSTAALLVPILFLYLV